MNLIFRHFRPGAAAFSAALLFAGLSLYAPSILAAEVTPPPGLPDAFEIDGIASVGQTWNNCGPATLSMGLDRWGIKASQADIAALIRPDVNDGHVSIAQIRSAAAAWGMESLYLPASDIHTVKTFVAAGFPVIMPTWHIATARNQMGHYRMVHGYDNLSGTFALRDSLEPAGYRMDYLRFDLLWRVFNRRMLVVYPPDRSGEIRAIAGPVDTGDAALELSLKTAEAENLAPAGLPEGMSAAHYLSYSDFNRAMALNSLRRYPEAAEAARTAFDRGLPWRMLWYQPEVLEAFYRTGDYSWMLRRIAAALDPYPYLEELWYWRSLAQAALGRPEESEVSKLRALEINPDWAAALQAPASSSGI